MERTRFDRILETQRHRIYGYALRCLRHPDDADDVTQEAFLRLWRHGPDVDDERLVGWVISVTHNLCIDRSRRARTWRKYVGDPSVAALDELTVTGDPLPAATAEHTALLDAVDALPAATRSLLWLHYWQGLKLGEIAAMLGLNQNTLKVRLHRARRTLRELLEQPRSGLTAQQQEQHG